jgi:signal transduction protein with GAF and PtsI domain
MGSSKNYSPEDRFRAFAQLADLSSVLTKPLEASLKNLLTMAAGAIDSEEASILVREGDSLRFEVVIGKVADQLIGMRIPLNKGVAGFVFSSGQPMAVGDAGSEASFYVDVDKQTGYSTQILLATPLRFDGEIVGVLEFVNRIGEPPYRQFTGDDMDKAAFFAEAIAALVDSLDSRRLIEKAGKILLESGKSQNPPSLSEMQKWLDAEKAIESNREMMEIAMLLREIAGRGAADRKLCREILAAVQKHGDKQEQGFLSY